MARQAGYDRHITIFSPEGKLFQIEYSFNAISLPGDTTIGVRGTDAVCLITTKRVEDKLMDADHVTRMYQVTPTIGACVTGRAADARALIYKARSIATEFRFDNGYQIPVRHLANELANYNQLFTQYAYKRVPGCSVLLSAIDDEIGARLYLVDPAGSCFGYKAVATGKKKGEGMATLEKLIREFEKEKETKTDAVMDEQRTIETAVEALQKVLGVDFKSNQVEVSVVSAASPRVRLLSEKEIDATLTAISERD